MNYTIHRDGYTRQKYICYWFITDYTCFKLRNKTLQAILSISCAPCDSVLSPSQGYQPLPDFWWNKPVFWVLNLLSKWNHIIILSLASLTQHYLCIIVAVVELNFHCYVYRIPFYEYTLFIHSIVGGLFLSSLVFIK